MINFYFLILSTIFFFHKGAFNAPTRFASPVLHSSISSCCTHQFRIEWLKTKPKHFANRTLLLLKLAWCMFVNDDVDIHEMNKIANNNNRITSILCNLFTFALYIGLYFASFTFCACSTFSFPSSIFRLKSFYISVFAAILLVYFAPFHHITASLVWMAKFHRALFQLSKNLQCQ